MFSTQLLDHFQNPRRAGDLDDADAVAEIENPVCGDVLRLGLRVADGKIADARFKAKGCVPAIACASALTELVVGKSLADVRTLNRDDVAAAVGGVPQASAHAAQLAVDVLAAALKKVESKSALRP
jgi:nitrogen fixation protein NifU and related proteins